jgi:hypothetical protein
VAHYNLKDAPITTPEQHTEVGLAFCKKLFADPDVTKKLLSNKVIVRFGYFDEENWGPGVTVDLTIDCTGDEIVIKVNGSIRTAMRLLPIIKPGFPIYRETLEELGYDDLLAFPPE